MLSDRLNEQIRVLFLGTLTNVCYPIAQHLDIVKEMVVRGIGTHLYHYSDLPYNGFKCDICPILPLTLVAATIVLSIPNSQF